MTEGDDFGVDLPAGVDRVAFRKAAEAFRAETARSRNRKSVAGGGAARGADDVAALCADDGGAAAGAATLAEPGVGVSLDDFRAFMPTHSYCFLPARRCGRPRPSTRVVPLFPFGTRRRSSTQRQGRRNPTFCKCLA